MNRLEFDAVMKTLDLENPIGTTSGRYGTTEVVHLWENLEIYFGGSFYAVVNGKVPYLVAERIYEKYPGNPYEIRINGGCPDTKPIDCATSDEFEDYAKKAFEEKTSLMQYAEACVEKSEEIKSGPKGSLYINGYHIDSKEGLLIFLTTMSDYILEQKFNSVGINVNRRKYPEYLEEVTKKLKPKKD